MPSYFSNLDRHYVALLFIAIGIIFLPTGSYLTSSQDQVYEQIVMYDSTSDGPCHITNRNQGLQCSVNFTITSDIDDDLYVYYKLSNFYQNHRRYVQSLSIPQLQGQLTPLADLTLSCNPLLYNGTLLLNPCGLIANSFFNDVISLNNQRSYPPTLTLDESNIALPSDVNSMYLQVQGFQSEPIDNLNVTCSDSGLPDNCKKYCDSSDQCYNFFYPNDETTQYLYESYPNQISPLEGVTNEHFIVWMRTAALPTFRKLYGVINGPFNKGDNITFDIINNFEVSSFDGTKSIVITNLGNLGARNYFMGLLYTSAGSIMLSIGGILAILEIYLRYVKKSN